MKTLQFLDLIKEINEYKEDIAERNKILLVRKSAYPNNVGFKKVAFDTRFIDQEIEYNPRRNLQYYNRSEPFLTQANEPKVQQLDRLKLVLENLKDKYQRLPQWQDSYARVLLNAIERSLNYKDGVLDVTQSQPSVGSIDYLEQLLHTRYRLTLDLIKTMSNDDLEKVILEKDHDLLKQDPIKMDIGKKSYQEIKEDLISKSTVNVTHQYNDFLNQVFSGIKVSAESPEVERTITITVKDKLVKES